MTTPDPLATTIAGCLTTFKRIDDRYLRLTGTAAPDGLTVTLEVRSIGFGTIGDQSRTVLLRLESPPAPDSNGAIDPVIAGGAA
jgi:hypothetical protein